MTIEIRQLVIKSNVDDGAATPEAKEPAQDGECGADHAGSAERQRMRSALAAELARLMER